MTDLGSLTWDFVAGTLSFRRRDTVVCWMGIAGPDTPALSASTKGEPAPNAPFEEPTARRPPGLLR